MDPRHCSCLDQSQARAKHDSRVHDANTTGTWHGSRMSELLRRCNCALQLLLLGEKELSRCNCFFVSSRSRRCRRTTICGTTPTPTSKSKRLKCSRCHCPNCHFSAPFDVAATHNNQQQHAPTPRALLASQWRPPRKNATARTHRSFQLRNPFQMKKTRECLETRVARTT